MKRVTIILVLLAIIALPAGASAQKAKTIDELANMFDEVQRHFKTITADRPKRIHRARRYDESDTA